MRWSEDIQKRVLEALKEHKAMAPCHRCLDVHFRLVDGFFVQFASDISSPDIGGSITTIPTAVTVCNGCGAVTQHVLSTLGIDLEEGKVAA